MIARRVILLLPLVVAGCSGSEPPEVYVPPSYAYLTPLRLNVATIQIDDRTSPVPTNAIEEAAPLRPADALRAMGRDRLFAAGSAGRAVLVLDRASLVRLSDGVEGRLAVHLDIYAGGDDRVAFAAAQVTRRQTGDGAEGRSPPALYRLVSQMMDDMNVEFEFQVRRSLKEYLQLPEGTSPPPPPVQTQDLPPPGRGAVVGPGGSLGPAAGHVLTRP